MKYLVIGAGGTGGALGAYLAKGGKDLTLIARGSAPRSAAGEWFAYFPSEGQVYRFANRGHRYGALPG